MLPWQPFAADMFTTTVEEMGMSKFDSILVKNLYEIEGYRAKRLMKEFS